MKNGLFSKFELGGLELSNRMALAPLTRNRVNVDGVPSAMMVEYYKQRATAGLIISESAPVSQQGLGYRNTPGLFTTAQTAGWLRVANAVHSEGGHIFAQLQHCGRISHPSLQEGEALPVAPSPIQPKGHAVTMTGFQDFVTPRALEVSEISDVIGQFRKAAENARDSGFDGVEVHGANGYLIDQFLRDGTNMRSDGYSGRIENRLRLLQEILDAVTDVFPAQRVGVRLSPENSFNDMSDTDPELHFEHIVSGISDLGIGYLHLLEGDMTGSRKQVDYGKLRDLFDGTYIANNGYDKARAVEAISNEMADLVAFGVPFLANPDLVRRFREDLPLNNVDTSTFYGGDETGYTDYPFAKPDLVEAA